MGFYRAVFIIARLLNTLKNTVEKYNNNTYIYALTSKYIWHTIKGMRYTVTQFKADFPDDDACLELIFLNRFGDLEFCPKCGAKTKFYRVKKRQCYACMHCGYQIHPLAKTIFRKSSTSLWNWFYAIYLFSVAKNGVSAKEIERHLGVTYKTAWRMAKQIRLLMQQDVNKLTGIVEADETYIGGKTTWDNKYKNKTSVLGLAEKNGGAKAVVADANATHALPFIRANVEQGSTIHTDESRIYSRVKWDFEHKFVNHSQKEYVKNGVHTNTIEGFWGQMKRSISGTYHCVSPKYLQSYVNEFVFRYNYRDVAVCLLLLEAAAKPV
jgi:transposase-like protein